MNRPTFFKIIKITLPIFFGYISIGIPFGLMVVNAGYAWWLPPLMSLVMYTGTGQYIAIGMFSAGASLAQIMVVQILVGVRHIFYGLSLINKFKNVGRWKPYLIFALTDETYAVLCSTEVPKGIKAGEFYGAISALDQFYWTLGTFLGGVAGSLIKIPLGGIDFALTALFAVILTEQISSSKDFLSPAVGIGSAVVAAVLERAGVLPSGNMLLAALAAGIAILIFLKRRGGAK